MHFLLVAMHEMFSMHAAKAVISVGHKTTIRKNGAAWYFPLDIKKIGGNRLNEA